MALEIDIFFAAYKRGTHNVGFVSLLEKPHATLNGCKEGSGSGNSLHIEYFYQY